MKPKHFWSLHWAFSFSPSIFNLLWLYSDIFDLSQAYVPPLSILNSYASDPLLYNPKKALNCLSISLFSHSSFQWNLNHLWSPLPSSSTSSIFDLLRLLPTISDLMLSSSSHCSDPSELLHSLSIFLLILRSSDNCSVHIELLQPFKSPSVLIEVIQPCSVF